MNKLLGVFSPKSLTVRAALVQAAIWAVLGNLAILLAYVIAGQVEHASLQASSEAATIRQRADIIASEFNRLATLEERLLRTKDLALLEEHQAIYASVENSLDNLREMIGQEESLGSVADAMVSVFHDYDDAFLEFIEAQKTVGLTLDTGLQGALEAASDTVELQASSSGDKRIAMIHRRVKGAERGYRRSADPSFLGAFEKAHERLVQIAQSTDMDMNTFVPAAQAYLTAMQDLVRENTALLAALDRVQSVAGQLPPLIEQVREQTNEAATSTAESADATRTMANIVVIGLVLLVAGLMVLGTIWLIRRIAPPLSSAVETCQKISDGNLDLQFTTDRTDEIGQLLMALQAMSMRLTEVVSEVHDTADAILQGAAEISSSTDYLSQRTEQSAASLEQTAASMDQMTATVSQNAANAREAATVADQARAKATDGGSVVERAIEAMEQINSSSKRVESVISVVDQIAFQTNLLALNAAVEAARAGDAGRGFAVVASEVRTLAQRSAESASEVKKLIGESTVRVQTGQKLVNESGELLREIVTEIQRVATIVSEISVATQEQAEGIQQVNNAIVDMDKVTQQNAAMVEEAASASTNMEERARELTALVAYFTLPGSNRSSTSRPSYSSERTVAPAERPAAIAPPTRSAPRSSGTTSTSKTHSAQPARISGTTAAPQHVDKDSWQAF